VRVSGIRYLADHRRFPGGDFVHAHRSVLAASGKSRLSWVSVQTPHLGTGVTLYNQALRVQGLGFRV
jgi:hypothetical protein